MQDDNVENEEDAEREEKRRIKREKFYNEVDQEEFFWILIFT